MEGHIPVYIHKNTFEVFLCNIELRVFFNECICKYILTYTKKIIFQILVWLIFETAGPIVMRLSLADS